MFELFKKKAKESIVSGAKQISGHIHVGAKVVGSRIKEQAHHQFEQVKKQYEFQQETKAKAKESYNQAYRRAVIQQFKKNARLDATNRFAPPKPTAPVFFGHNHSGWNPPELAPSSKKRDFKLL